MNDESIIIESQRPETLPVERADLDARLALLGATNPELQPPKLPDAKPRRRPKPPYGSYVMLGALAFLVGILGTITALEYSTPRVASADEAPIADVSAVEVTKNAPVAAAAIVQLEPIDIVVDTTAWQMPSRTEATVTEAAPVRRAVRRPLRPVILATPAAAPEATELPPLSEAPATDVDAFIASLAEPAPRDVLGSPIADAEPLAAR